MASESDYHSPLLARPGAMEAPDSEVLLDAQGVAWHYGNPFAEQRTLTTTGAVVDRSHRSVIAVSGPDAGTLLNSLLSQKLDDAPDGFCAQALNLDAHGRILQCVDVTRVKDTFYLDTPHGDAVELADYLTAMKFWSYVSISITDLGILSVLVGDESLLPTPPKAAVFSRHYPWRGIPRLDIAVDRSKLDEAVTEIDLPLAGLMAFTAERVKAVEPERGADVDAITVPHEVPHWIGRGENLGAVHLHKGCYRGQETVARVENLGRSPRLLVKAQLDGSAPTSPTPGAQIHVGSKVVGRLGTVVDDFEEGPIALVLVKRSALHELWDVDGVAATLDPTSLPVTESEGKGRQAQAKFRRLQNS